MASDEISARAPTSIPRRQERGAVHLSDTQRRMWFLAKLDPESPAYNVGNAHHLTGAIDGDALARALRCVVARHEILRSTYAVVDDEPRQTVREEGAVDFQVFDLSATPPAQRDEALQRLLVTETHRPFDLVTGPLLRMRLVNLGERESVLLRVMHHIASDGWSSGIFDGELSTAYNACVKGREPELPALPIQYADYALWQRERLQGEVLDQRLGYWKAKLTGLSTLELPTDRPRPPVLSYQGARATFALPEPTTRALKELGRRERSTPFMTLLAAFQVLLHRYSGQDDIAVGTPIAGRGRTELEGLIGFFANTLVLRVDLSGNPGFRELLARVRASALDAYTHPDLPFEKLVEELAPERDLSRNPLFQVAFALQNAPGSALALDGIQVSRLPLQTLTAKFDLTLTLRETAEGLQGDWEYCTDLFDAQTIERMARHFERLLEGIVADPEQCIGELPLLTEAEQHQLLVEWNDTAADYPRDRCIHQLFEAQATRTPEAVAVVFEDRQLTYDELNARANQLAHYLIDLGVGPEVLVGICMERSLELIIGLLAILKAGGAYVPLDPSYPKERLALMLKDTAAPVLLTQQGLLAQLPPYEGHMLCVDRDWPQISAHSAANPTTTATAHALAYVIYTSGSTGAPKGVAVRQRGVVRLVRNPNYVTLSPSQTMAQVSNVTFDAATFEIWGALLNGARLVIVAKDVALAPESFAAALTSNQITCLFLTTALFNRMSRALPRAFRDVRYLMFGGEACDPDRVRTVLEQGPPEHLIHVYGPTETTTFATFHRVLCVHEGDQTIPIGRPISRTQVFILDRYNEPVPIGITGEIHIGGPGVAACYVNRPQETEARFIAHPFCPDSGERLYRTGDLARYLPDGNIVFLGRNDAQIKIRGFRVEPAEIQAVLNSHAAVRESFVTAQRQLSGDAGLTAYYCPESGAEVQPSVSDLRHYLSSRLPQYMVPNSFVAMSSLPLTPIGKIDRSALPALSAAVPRELRSYAAPRDKIEQTLCQIWEEMLGAGLVGLDDNFFELGGHSLLAASLFTRLDQALGRSLPLATLFEAPTVRGLARFYREGADPRFSSTLIPITSSGALPPLFAVPGVYGNVICFAELAHELGLEQPFYGLQSIGLDGVREPLESIEEMAAQYLSEVRQHQPHGPYYLIGACFGATVAWEMARQLLDMNEEVAFLGLLDPSTIGDDRAGKAHVPLPPAIKRGLALGRFVANRLRIYRREMRSLGFRERLQFVGKRVQLLGEVLEKRDVFRGDRREFNQRKVYDANLAALLRYGRASLGRGPMALEIFETERVLTKKSSRERMDWGAVAGVSAGYHRVRGKDSGDMLQSDNAKAIAALLSVRLRDARRGTNDR